MTPQKILFIKSKTNKKNCLEKSSLLTMSAKLILFVKVRITLSKVFFLILCKYRFNKIDKIILILYFFQMFFLVRFSQVAEPAEQEYKNLITENRKRKSYSMTSSLYRLV